MKVCSQVFARCRQWPDTRCLKILFITAVPVDAIDSSFDDKDLL